MFRIVNTGERPIRVTGIGWRIGIRRWQRNALQMHDATQSSPLPIELSHGQEASWSIPLQYRERKWLSSFAEKMLSPRCRFTCFTIRAQFYTSVGTTFSVKPERGLLALLRDACQNAANDR